MPSSFGTPCFFQLDLVHLTGKENVADSCSLIQQPEDADNRAFSPLTLYSQRLLAAVPQRAISGGQALLNRKHLNQPLQRLSKSVQSLRLAVQLLSLSDDVTAGNIHLSNVLTDRRGNDSALTDIFIDFI